MPDDEEDRGVPSSEEANELAEAQALLQDPAQVAPVDTQKLGKRFVEILMQALRRKGSKVKR
jgi:hypothetical protein